MTADELRVISDLTVRLVEMLQSRCEWLCIENIGPEIFGKLLCEYQPRTTVTQAPIDVDELLGRKANA